MVADRTSGDVAPTAKVPDVLGRVSVGVPAALCGVIVAVPEVTPVSLSCPVEVPATPRVGVTEKAGTPRYVLFKRLG